MGIRTAPASDAQLIDKYINTSFDVIRKAVDNLETIELFGSIEPDSEIVKFLQEILNNIDGISGVINSAELIRTASTDIEKGNYLGNRKTDIDISLNKVGIAESTSYEEALAIWQDTTTTVYYSSAVATFVDGTIIEVPFVNDDLDPIIISTHGSIIQQLLTNVSFTNKLENTGIIEEIGGKVGTLIRIYDVTGTSSNLERISLTVSSGNAVAASPVYYWTLTTSALQTLANRVGDIIALGNNIQNVILLANSIDEVLGVQAALTEVVAIYNELTKLLRLHTSIDNLDRLHTSITGLDSLYASITTLDNLALSLTELEALHTNLNILTDIYNDLATITRVHTSIGNLDRLHTSILNLDRLHTSITNLDTIANSIANVDITAGNINNINILANNISNLTSVYNSLTAINTITTQLVEINAVYTNLTAINTVATNIAHVQNAVTNATIASNAATTATTQAGIATTKANLAVAEVDKIEALSATAQTLAPGSNASAFYNSTTGVLTLGIPQGLKGDKGDSFTVNAVGVLTDRPLYDAQIKGFSFLAIDEALLYFKLSNTSGDWSLGSPFGKGEKGDTGDTGNGIVSIVRTAGDGSAGSIDTYTITYTDATTSSFNVYNGQDGVIIDDAAVSLIKTWSSDKINSQIELKKTEAIETAVAMAIVFG